MSNDLKDRADQVMQEFARNFDKKEPKYVNLIEEFMRFLREKDIRPKDVSDAKAKIEYMDEVMKKIRQINRANDVLKTKYKNDEMFARVHKRIVEENEIRIDAEKKPVISDTEYEIAEGLNRLKEWVDQIVFLNQGILSNETAFDRDVLRLVGEKLLDLGITSNLNDRKFIQHQITKEYHAQYERLMTN